MTQITTSWSTCLALGVKGSTGHVTAKIIREEGEGGGDGMDCYWFVIVVLRIFIARKRRLVIRVGFWSSTAKAELNRAVFTGVKRGELRENWVGPSGGFALALTNETALVTLCAHVTPHVTWHVTRRFEAVLFAALFNYLKKKKNHLCNLGLLLSGLKQ